MKGKLPLWTKWYLKTLELLCYQFYDQLRISYAFRIMSCYVAVSWK